jgi:phosphopantothenoylcysteine decarboxylase/phosphopantothenate--cysteine ligase
LSTIYLATSAAAIVAPAMNVHMWQHAATRRNVERLRADGAIFIGPDIGEQACGETGPGRMAEPTEIVDRVAAVLDDHNTARDGQDTTADGPLIGVRVLITAGPTREPIDPVRYISNHSSGKQGFALAKAARRAGADVTLIAGPVQLATPSGVTRIDVTTAMEMHAAVERAVADQQIFVSVAAVSDYRPIKAQAQKIKKTNQNSTEISVPLTENPDILKCVANRTKRPFVVGFAAETQNALAYAREKRLSKGLDAIIVNDVSDPRIGFDSNDNAVTLIHANGETYFPIQEKEIIAEKLVDAIAELFHRN